MPNASENENDILTKPQVATMVQQTVRTVENHMKAGRLPYYKLGRSVRFRRGDILSFLNETCRVVRTTAA